MSEYTPDMEDAQGYYSKGRAAVRRARTGELGLNVTPYSHEFDRFIAQIRADAWDEGQRAGLGDGLTAAELAIGRRPDLLPGPTPNPYRQEAQR